jgi:hypothetical protein
MEQVGMTRRRAPAAQANPDDDIGVMTPEFAALSPTIQGALTVENLERTRLGRDYQALDVNALTDLLVKGLKRFHYNDLRGIENGLLSQANVLNLVFHRFIRSACDAYMDEQRVIEAGIAFRAQSQYRATLATLAAIKNPTAVAFVNQANIANGPQQVNNGCTVRNGTESRLKTKNRPSKLSGRKRELLPNPRASAAKSDAHSKMEALEAVHRTEDA